MDGISDAAYIIYVISQKMNLCHLMNHRFNILFDSQEQYVAMETWVCLVINALFFPLTRIWV